MSQITAGRREQGDLSLIGGIVAMVVLAGAIAWFLSRGTEIPLERSAMGHNGLEAWLRAEGIETNRAGLAQVSAADVGLRILPILDSDLRSRFVAPKTREEYLKTATERDITQLVVLRKLQLLPTLMIAPKWTRAARHSGYLHESLLMEPNQVQGVMRAAGLTPVKILRPQDDFVMIRANGEIKGEVTLYAPQLFDSDLPPKCSKVVSSRDGVLLVRCEGSGRPYYALSDPDILNNHGLSLAGNAEFAASLVRHLTGDKPVLIDTTVSIFAVEDQTTRPERTLADLLRVFHWPFSIVWVGLGLMTLLGLWRAWVRFGPPREVFDDAIGASRETSIAAKARLLRMAGNDHRLFEAHVQGRLKMIASALAGPHASATDPIKQIVDIVRRRDPDLAAGFASAAAAATTPRSDLHAQRLQSLLEDFEIQAERVLNGFGRV